MNPRIRLFACLLFLLAYSLACRAGGSILWTDARADVAKDDPFLADYIAKNFDVYHAGVAVRVGHDKDGNSLVPGLGVGARMPPYEFLAKPRGASGGYTLYLTLNPESFDNDRTTLWVLTLRKALPSEIPGDQGAIRTSDGPRNVN